jgi:hypothetical protein
MGARTFYRGAAAIAAISLMLPAAAPAQTSKAGVVTTLQGTATVARSSAPDPAPLKFKDDVFVQDRITTGEESIARILLGGKAVVTIRERSSLTITETATSSTIEMTSGKIALSVDKSRVKPGESVEIKTPNAVAAIRGTIIIAEVDPPSSQSPDSSTRFTLLTGVVDVTRIDQTGRLTGAPVILKPLQSLGVSGIAPLATPRPITRVEADAVAASFATPLREPSPSANAKVVDDQVQEATKRAAVVTTDSKDKDKDKSDTAARDDGKSNGKGKDDSGDRSGGSATASTSGGTGSSTGSAGSSGSTGGTTSTGSSGAAGSTVAGTSGSPAAGGSVTSSAGAGPTSGGSAASAGDIGRVVAVGGNTLGNNGNGNGNGARTGVPGGLATGGGVTGGGIGVIAGDDLRGRDKTPRKDRTR